VVEKIEECVGEHFVACCFRNDRSFKNCERTLAELKSFFSFSFLIGTAAFVAH
jgi:hypothetical protein